MPATPNPDSPGARYASRLLAVTTGRRDAAGLPKLTTYYDFIVCNACWDRDHTHGRVVVIGASEDNCRRCTICHFEEGSC